MSFFLLFVFYTKYDILKNACVIFVKNACKIFSNFFILFLILCVCVCVLACIIVGHTSVVQKDRSTA